MRASSSFRELNTSSPPNLHSPLWLVKTEERRTFPCIEEASSLINDNVFYRPIQYVFKFQNTPISYCNREEAPFRSFHTQAFTPCWPFQRCDPFCSNVDLCLCLWYVSDSTQKPILPSMMAVPPLYRRLWSVPDVSEFASFELRFERVVSGICLR